MHNQLGSRLVFWVNLLLTDFNLDSYSKYMRSNGQGADAVSTLGNFAHVGLLNFDGTSKPALEVWDEMRKR